MGIQCREYIGGRSGKEDRDKDRKGYYGSGAL